MLIAVGEGEFEGTPTAADIYLDNTPINDASGNVNFQNVNWEWRTGSVDQSYNYLGQSGWILNKNGTLEINGMVAGGGRLVITNRSVRVYDQNGVKRVQLGDLSE